MEIAGETSLKNSTLKLQNVLKGTDFVWRKEGSGLPSFRSGDEEHHCVVSWLANGKGSEHGHGPIVQQMRC